MQDDHHDSNVDSTDEKISPFTISFDLGGCFVQLVMLLLFILLCSVFLCGVTVDGVQYEVGCSSGQGISFDSQADLGDALNPE